MKHKPDISIVIPCFNAEKTVGATLDSILAQSYQDYEVIAVNDGSSDATGDILGEYTDKFTGRLAIVSQVNQGQTVAKNVGTAHASGRFVAFIDSDDMWAPEKLSRQIEFLEHNSHVGLCYTNGYYIDEQNNRIEEVGVSPDYRGRCFQKLLMGNNMVASSVMVRTEVLDKVGWFDEELRACENWELWTRIAQSYEIDYIDEPLTYYRQHDDNMMRDIDKMRKYRLMVIEKNHLRYKHIELDIDKFTKDAYFMAYSFFGGNYLWELDIKKARKDLLKAIRLNPTAISCYRMFIKSLLGEKLIHHLRSLKARF